MQDTDNTKDRQLHSIIATIILSEYTEDMYIYTGLINNIQYKYENRYRQSIQIQLTSHTQS